MAKHKRAELVDSVVTEVRKFIAAVILFNQRIGEEIGLNATDMQALHLLQLQGSATPGELARQCGLTTGGTTVVLDRLENSGYVRREPNPNDRRSSIVKPVRARIRKLEPIYAAHYEHLKKVLSDYDETQLGLLLDFFSKTGGSH